MPIGLRNAFLEKILSSVRAGERMTSLIRVLSQSLHLFLAQLASQIFGLPNCQRDYGQGRIFSPAAGELAAVGDEQVRNVVGLAIFVANAIPRLFALTAGTHVVSTGERRQLEHLASAE